ncbi:hypothetical protein ACVCAH_23725 [Micromonospora sp. LZ34]
MRFVAHYGFRPDFCEAKDPESKGAVEAAVRLAKSDLVVPADDFGGDLSVANAAAVAWCAEINAKKHSETQAIADDRLAVERDVLRPLPSLRLESRRGVSRKVDKLSTVRMCRGDDAGQARQLTERDEPAEDALAVRSRGADEPRGGGRAPGGSPGIEALGEAGGAKAVGHRNLADEDMR